MTHPAHAVCAAGLCRCLHPLLTAVPRTNNNQAVPNTNNNQAVPRTNNNQAVPRCNQHQAVPRCNQYQAVPCCKQQPGRTLLQTTTRQSPAANNNQAMPRTNDNQAVPRHNQHQAVPCCNQHQAVPCCKQRPGSALLQITTRPCPAANNNQAMPRRRVSTTLPTPASATLMVLMCSVCAHTHVLCTARPGPPRVPGQASWSQGQGAGGAREDRPTKEPRCGRHAPHWPCQHTPHTLMTHTAQAWVRAAHTARAANNAVWHLLGTEGRSCWTDPILKEPLGSAPACMRVPAC